ncbi:DUF3015 family protein [Halopseudomonas xiamenensis]|uniref:DUF3015 family protein n=1 Tax=Halopseudomonas xiamenensis TaxID=157792 RepID=UPI0016231B8C|nr:DUF3015 family protein [Halopseudomonas xiamenensis]
MIMKKLAVFTLLTCTAAASSAIAQNKTPGSGPNPFTDCGIGAALFPNTHWAAVTSNVIWDIGITAVTSATASPQTCSGKTVETALFIRDTYDTLVEETARGEGEHLATVLNMMECDSSRHAAATQTARAAMTQQVISAEYSSQSQLAKAASFYSIIESSAALNCSV